MSDETDKAATVCPSCGNPVDPGAGGVVYAVPHTALEGMSAIRSSRGRDGSSILDAVCSPPMCRDRYRTLRCSATSGRDVSQTENGAGWDPGERPGRALPLSEDSRGAEPSFRSPGIPFHRSRSKRRRRVENGYMTQHQEVPVSGRQNGLKRCFFVRTNQGLAFVVLTLRPPAPESPWFACRKRSVRWR